MNSNEEPSNEHEIDLSAGFIDDDGIDRETGEIVKPTVASIKAAATRKPQTPVAAPDKPERTSFATFLLQQRAGSLEADLTDELAELVQNVIETGRAGKLQLVIAIKPNTGGHLDVTDQIKITAPARDMGSSVFWADEAGNLLRRPHNQPPLFPDDY